MIPAVKKGAAHLRMCSAQLLHILYFQAIITQINMTLILLNNVISAFLTFLNG
ncbi:hypothetical protein D2M30_1097 [Bacillus amyloliquefaciens]|nr:hypothetical protein D2M30_1097 [Bacillus amyloliquefaciens]